MKKENRKNKLIALFEIFIMLTATIAFAYIVNEASGNTSEVNSNSNNILLKIYSKIVNSIFGKNLVSATAAFSTCLKSKDGKICQEYTPSECGTLCEPGKCVPAVRDQVAQCKIGTCQNPTEGTCEPGSPKEACETSGGTWYNDPFGNNAECKKACCSLGNNDITSFVTQTTCSRIGNVTGAPVTFNNNIRDELTCLRVATNQEKGACVLARDSDKTCRFTTRADCLVSKGNFSAQKLCTNAALGTICKPTTKTTCVDGKDEVYFTDTCGNIGNIYNSNKVNVQSYWDVVVDKRQSCGTGNSNIDSISCGNCNYLSGSLCRTKGSKTPVKGDYMCQSLNCKDDNGNNVKNGESWCLYDGKIGNGLDVVGSRYFKRVCRNGAVSTEPCADFRNEICINGITKIDNVDFKSATCRINRWQDCLAVNTGGTATDSTEGECTDNSECMIKHINIDKDFKFDRCVPKYPEGFDVKDNPGAAKSFCSMGTSTCPVVYQKKFSGWKCITNCKCEKKGFTQQLNNLCISLGDCGGYVNINGDVGSSGYLVKGAAKIDASGYKDNAKSSPGQRIDAGNTTGDDNREFAQGAMSAMYGNPEDPTPPEDPYGTISAVVAGVGALAGLVATAAATSATAAAMAIGGAVGASAAAAAPIMAALVVAAPFLFAFAIIAIIFVIVMKVLGVGKVKIKLVHFTCLPWEPPVGGSQCEKCMNDPIKPCSKYRCQSMGLRCNFINEGTSKEDCIDINPKDASAPVIQPLQGILPFNFTYENVSSLGYKISSRETDGCISSFTPLVFGIKTDEPSQCKVSINRTGTEQLDSEINQSDENSELTPEDAITNPVNLDRFDEMENYFGDSLYLTNHSVGNLIVPSVESLGLAGYGPNRTVDFNLYVRCRDLSNNKNPVDYAINFCVKPGKDIFPPVITGKEPNHDLVAYNASSRILSVFTNEPATCRWMLNDTDYDSMNNSFFCLSGVYQQEMLGWRCAANITTPGNETGIYIRCKDQPWDENVNETNRNANVEAYKMVLRKSEKLVISSVSPNNETIWSGNEPVTVTLKATTTGGGNGIARCLYKIGNGTYINFLSTFGGYHEQPFGSFLRGDKEISVKCDDFVGNVDEKIAKFNISIDTTPPLVTRIYNSNNNLVAVTNEPGECRFVKGNFIDYRCDFVNSSAMSGLDLLHSTALDNSATYYIKCADRFGNIVNGSCNAIAKGGLI